MFPLVKNMYRHESKQQNISPANATKSKKQSLSYCGGYPPIPENHNGMCAILTF